MDTITLTIHDFYSLLTRGSRNWTRRMGRVWRANACRYDLRTDVRKESRVPGYHGSARRSPECSGRGNEPPLKPEVHAPEDHSRQRGVSDAASLLRSRYRGSDVTTAVVSQLMLPFRQVLIDHLTKRRIMYT